MTSLFNRAFFPVPVNAYEISPSSAVSVTQVFESSTFKTSFFNLHRFPRKLTPQKNKVSSSSDKSNSSSDHNRCRYLLLSPQQFHLALKPRRNYPTRTYIHTHVVSAATSSYAYVRRWVRLTDSAFAFTTSASFPVFDGVRLKYYCFYS